MARIVLPQTRWIAGAPGEFQGNIWHGVRIDLDRNRGKVSLGDSFTALANSSSGVTNLKTAFAFVRTAADGTDRYWAATATGATGGRLFKTTNTDPEAGWAEDAIASSPTAALYDAIEFGDALLVATATDVDRLSTSWDTDWWSDLAVAVAMQSGVPHRFCIYAGAVLITDGRYINDYDGTTARDPALTLPADQQADWIEVGGDYVFIGGRSVGGAGESDIFHWDRTSTVFTARYGSGDSRVFAGFTVNGIPHIVTRKGEIKRFTGQGYRMVARFPAAELDIPISNLDPNGIVVDKNIVKMLVSFGASTGTGFGLYSHRVLDGIWTFDADTYDLYLSGMLPNSAANDYGQGELSEVGAMIYTNPTQGRYLVGARAYTVYTGTTRYIIASSDEASTSGRGYFITPKISAGNIRRFMREFAVRFRRLDASSDRIRVAYQIQDSNTLPAYSTITWVNATSFTTTNTDVAAGDFVEIIAGANAGALAKVVTVAGTPTVTVTIDLTLNASTATARARFLPFIDLGTISSQALQSQIFRLTRRSEWVRLLIELRGTEMSPQIENLVLDFDEIPR